MYGKLKEAMEREGVTQRCVARLLGVHYNTICARLHGRTKKDFSVQEAALIYATWFSQYDFMELFSAQIDE